MIESLDFGIKIGSVSIDIILYADDLLLITDTKWKLSQMLNILTNFGQNSEIKFNGSKTTLMIYNKRMGDNRRMFIESENKVKLELSGENIVPTDKMKYLGCIYSNTYSQ